jgi:hypothetical protein
MATIKFKIKNGLPPYIVKLISIGITGDGNYGYNVYDGVSSFTQQKVSSNDTFVEFTSVPSGSYVLEIVDDTKFSTVEFVNVP